MPSRGPAFAIVLLVLVTLAAYANCLPGDFVFDDQSTIFENPSIRKLWPLSEVLNPPANAGICGRPFANLTMALNYAANGVDIRGYHAVNLAIHLGAALVLFGVVRRTLLLPALRERFEDNATWLALAVAALWALHPLNSIVVNYVSQRVEELMALFYLLTLYGFIRSVTSAARVWPVLAVVACLLGMASKEVMVTAPVVIFLYDRTFVAGSFREAWRQRWKLHLSLAAMWLPLAGFMSTAQLDNRGIGFGIGMSSFDYALNECRAVLLYLKLALWGSPLVFDYGWDFLPTRAAALPYVIGIAVLAGATLFALWRRPMLGFLGAWFLVVLAPSSSVVPLVQQPIAESRAYLPSVAIVAVVVIGMHALGGRRALWFCAALALAASVATWHRNRDYRDPITLWLDTVTKRPSNARAHNNVGYALLHANRIAEAQEHFQAATRLRPTYENAYCGLGEIHLLENRTEEALKCFMTALRYEPNHLQAHNDLGILFLQLGKTEDAIHHEQAALRINPRFLEAHYNLGNALARAGHMAEAMAEYDRALELDPKFVRAHNNLGVLLLLAGKRAEAIAQFETALKINPDYTEARRNLEKAKGGMNH